MIRGTPSGIQGIVINPETDMNDRPQSSDLFEGDETSAPAPEERPYLWSQSTFGAPVEEMEKALEPNPGKETREAPGPFGDVFLNKDGQPFMYRDMSCNGGFVCESQLMLVVPDPAGGVELKPLTSNGGLTYEDITKAIETPEEYAAFEEAAGIDGRQAAQRQIDGAIQLADSMGRPNYYGEQQLRNMLLHGAGLYELPDRINALYDGTNGKVTIPLPDQQLGLPADMSLADTRDLFQGGLPSMKQYESVLRTIEGEIGKYPPEFWDNPNTPPIKLAITANPGFEFGAQGAEMDTKTGVGQIHYTNTQTPAEVQAEINHEIWHYYLAQQGLDGRGWATEIYGPAAQTAYVGEGWKAVSELYANAGMLESAPGYARLYSMANGFEDGATTAEGMFTNFGDMERLALSDPILADKMDLVIRAAEQMSNGVMNREWFRNLSPIYETADTQMSSWSAELKREWAGARSFGLFTLPYARNRVFLEH